MEYFCDVPGVNLSGCESTSLKIFFDRSLAQAHLNFYILGGKQRVPVEAALVPEQMLDGYILVISVPNPSPERFAVQNASRCEYTVLYA